MFILSNTSHKSLQPAPAHPEPGHEGYRRKRLSPGRILSFLFLIVFSPAAVSAQQPSKTSFSLKEAVDYAIANSPNVKNARIDQAMSELKSKEFLGLGYPQINASFDFKDFVELPTSLIPAEFFGGPPGTFQAIKFGTQYNATGALQVSQLLFNSDFFVGVTATRKLAELAEINVERSEQEVRALVTKAYYNVLVSRERLKILDINLERLEKLLGELRKLNEEGFAEAIDVERIEVARNNLQVEKDKIHQLAGISETLLKFQMGMELSSPITLTDVLDLDAIPTAGTSTQPKASYANRPEYKLMQTQLTLNNIELKRYRLSYLPSAFAYGNLSAQYQRNDFEFFTSRWYPIGIIGFTVQMPIFDGLQKHRRIQQARLNIQKTENTIVNFENAVDLEVNVAWITYENALKSITVQKRNLELAQHVFDVTQIKYKEGVGPNIEVVNAESALKEAQTNYMNAVGDYYIAKVDLEKALGVIK